MHNTLCAIPTCSSTHRPLHVTYKYSSKQTQTITQDQLWSIITKFHSLFYKHGSEKVTFSYACICFAPRGGPSPPILSLTTPMCIACNLVDHLFSNATTRACISKGHRIAIASTCRKIRTPSYVSRRGTLTNVNRWSSASCRLCM